MKQPSQRNTTNREEMVCPRCDTEGLEENPAYRGEYSGTAALLKSTRCPNEDCDYHYGLPQKEIERQMPENAVGGGFLGNLIPSEFDLNTILTAIFIIGGLGFMMMQFGLLPIGGDGGSSEPIETNIEGQVVDEDFDTQGLSLELIDDSGETVSTATVDSNETYEFSNIDVEEGTYMLYIIQDDELGAAPSGSEIEITEDGDVADETALDFELVESEEFEINQTVSDATISLDYANPSNTEDIELNLSPIEGDNVERTQVVEAGESENILSPVSPSSEETRVTVPETVEEQVETKQFTGSESTYDVIGNDNAENMEIVLTNESSADVSSTTVDVDGDTQETIDVASEETLGPVNVTLRDGTSQAQEQETGTWDGQDNITFTTGVEEYTSANIQIEPDPIETSEEITGEISGSTITPTFDGNMPVDDAQIEFEGGDADASIVGDEIIDGNAEDGSTGEIVEELGTVDDSGTYRLDWDADVTENSDLVEFWYEVNGDREEISEGSDGESLSLDSDDTVSLGIESQRDTIGDDESEPSFAPSFDDDIEVTGIEFSDDNPDPGETIEVWVTLENTGGTDINNEEMEISYNDDGWTNQNIDVSGNEEKEIGGSGEFGTMNVGDEEGTGVFWINDEGPFFIEVGDSEPTYGEGDIDAQLSDVGAEGEVSIDTTGDGELDCTELANDGTCEFDDLDDGGNTIDVEEEGVANTEYTITYTSQENPRDITIDMGEDGITDMDTSGVLTETESQTVEIPPNEATMDIQSENNAPVRYSVTWESEAVIENPVVEIDGDTKISGEDSFQEPRSFELDELPQGEHTFRFRADSGGYTADIEWAEDEGQSYPEAVINGETACEQGEFAQNLTCVTDVGTSPGEHTIDFNQAPDDSFNYQIQYDARAVADEVDVEVNDDSVGFDRPGPEPEPWDDVTSTSMLQTGDNMATVSTPDADGMIPDAEAEFSYVIDTGTVENPEIIVENADGDTNTAEIPSTALDDGQLVDDADILIEEEWLTAGENTISIRTEDGVFELSGDVTLGDDTIEFDSDD